MSEPGTDSKTSAKNPTLPIPPTEVDPAAIDTVSMLTALQFGVYAAMFQHASARFAVAHEMLVKSLSENIDSHILARPCDTTAATWAVGQ